MTNSEIKTDSSPADKAVFGALNAALVGFVFSLHLFNKIFGLSELLTIRQKLSFTGRNMLLFSTVYGLNQYVLDYMRKSKISDRNIINITSAVIPCLIGHTVYNYKNNFKYFTSGYFLGLAGLFYIIEQFDLNINRKQQRLNMYKSVKSHSNTCN